MRPFLMAPSSRTGAAEGEDELRVAGAPRKLHSHSDRLAR
jgi:hypothetical protein